MGVLELGEKGEVAFLTCLGLVSPQVGDKAEESGNGEAPHPKAEKVLDKVH